MDAYILPVPLAKLNTTLRPFSISNLNLTVKQTKKIKLHIIPIMARNKRVLDEADPNTGAAPVAKKKKDAKPRKSAKDASSAAEPVKEAGVEAAPSAKKKKDAKPGKSAKDASSIETEGSRGEFLKDLATSE